MASSHVWFAAARNKPDWKSSIPVNCTLEWNTRSIRTPDPEISFEDSKMAEIWQSCDTKLWWIWKIWPEKCWRCLGVQYHKSPSALWLCMHIGGNRLRDWPYSQLSDLHDLGSGHMAQRHVAFVNLYLHKFCSNLENFLWTHRCTDIETGFITSTQRSRPKYATCCVHSVKNRTPNQYTFSGENRCYGGQMKETCQLDK